LFTQVSTASAQLAHNYQSGNTKSKLHTHQSERSLYR